MRRRPILCGLIFFVSILVLSGSNLLAQDDEITLYNFDGRPVAYIAISEDYTIYLWNGKPVAYLYELSKKIHVYNFEGKHLGWFEDGIIIDHNGNAVGFINGALNVPTQFEPFKSFKQFKPLKGLRELPPLKPLFSGKWSLTPLQIFLLFGEAEPAMLLKDINNGDKIIILRLNNEEAWLLEAKTWCRWSWKYEGEKIWIIFGHSKTTVINEDGDVCEFWTEKEIEY
ncbi:MAG: 4-fold beta flower protein [Candidatus Kryptoniota bacterium]